LNGDIKQAKKILVIAKVHLGFRSVDIVYFKTIGAGSRYLCSVTVQTSGVFLQFCIRQLIVLAIEQFAQSLYCYFPYSYKDHLKMPQTFRDYQHSTLHTLLSVRPFFLQY
jgi:hypothetical protein